MNRALVIVDYQNDFADPKGALYVAGGEAIWMHIAPLVRMRNPIVVTQDWHGSGDPSFKSSGLGGTWPDHCVRGTWGADLYPALPNAVGDMILRKTSYNAFEDETGASTGLHEYLRGNWVSDIDVVGLALDFCVKETALWAARQGYGVRVIRHATRAVFPDKADEVLHQMVQAGVLIG